MEYRMQILVLVIMSFSFQAVAGNHKKVFYMNALMRMRLTPAGDKMVISTMNGLIVVIHDLDLTTIEEDFKGFKPNMYRLLQLSGKKITDQTQYTRLFKAKRNLIEFLTDFPDEDDAEMISSLQIHPQGWVAVSRNVTADQEDEVGKSLILESFSVFYFFSFSVLLCP